MAQQLNATCNSETTPRARTKPIFVDKQRCYEGNDRIWPVSTMLYMQGKLCKFPIKSRGTARTGRLYSSEAGYS